MKKQKIIILTSIFFVLAIVLNYFYGPYIYANILEKQQLYTIGQICETSGTSYCEGIYFKDDLDKIASLTADSRSFFSDIIIQADQVGYTGNCPCPYNSDSRGNSCGGRSSYSKSGKISYCYDRDVSDSQVQTLKSSMLQQAQDQLKSDVQNATDVYSEKYTLELIIVLYCALLFYFRKKIFYK